MNEQKKNPIKYRKVIYIAGKFRPSVEGDQFEQTMNILSAMRVALDVWKLGAVALVPHGNTFCFQGSADDEIWLEGDKILLERCDALLCVPNWEQSRGALAEIEYAEALGKPVFKSPFFLEEWLRNGSVKEQ